MLKEELFKICYFPLYILCQILNNSQKTKPFAKKKLFKIWQNMYKKR